MVPLHVKWMLLFEDPISSNLYLCKACPRSWFETGQSISVLGAPIPSMEARLSFNISSGIGPGSVGRIAANISVDSRTGVLPAMTLVLRSQNSWVLSSVKLSGRDWGNFSGEEIRLPKDRARIEVAAIYDVES